MLLSANVMYSNCCLWQFATNSLHPITWAFKPVEPAVNLMFHWETSPTVSLFIKQKNRYRFICCSNRSKLKLESHTTQSFSIQKHWLCLNLVLMKDVRASGGWSPSLDSSAAARSTRPVLALSSISGVETSLSDSARSMLSLSSSSSITGRCLRMVDFRITVLGSGMVAYKSRRWYRWRQHCGVLSLISSMIVFSLTAGEDVSAMSIVTESLRFKDCGGVITSDWKITAYIYIYIYIYIYTHTHTHTHIRTHIHIHNCDSEKLTFSTWEGEKGEVGMMVWWGVRGSLFSCLILAAVHVDNANEGNK